MVTEKTVRFVNRNWDLSQLSQQIVNLLNGQKWMTQKVDTSKGTVIQARKEDILRDIFVADRALTILVAGQPNDFSIRVGIGRWIQNLAVTAVEAILTSGLWLIIDVPEMVWNRHIENDVVSKINQLVESKPAMAVPAQ